MGACCSMKSQLDAARLDTIDVDNQNNEKEAFETMIMDMPLPKKKTVSSTNLSNHLKLVNVEKKKTKHEGDADFATYQSPGQKFKVQEILSLEDEEFIKHVLTEKKIIPDFDEDTINEFIVGFYALTVDVGFTFYSMGEEAQMLYIIRKGKVELTNSVNKRICPSGEFFGIDSFDENIARSEKAVACEKTTVLAISGDFYRKAKRYNSMKHFSEKSNMLSKIIFFRHLDPQVLITITNHLIVANYKHETVIQAENENIDRIFLIKQGTVKVTKNFQFIKILHSGDTFGEISMIMKLPSYYTYTVNCDNTLTMIEILFQTLKDTIGGNFIKEGLKKMFTRAIQQSELIHILADSLDNIFPLCKLRWYENEDVVFPADMTKNKKLCLLLSGKLKKQKTNDIVANSEDIYGGVIIDMKKNLDSSVVSDDESLVLEISWIDILKALTMDNQLDINEAVQRLKLLSMFSSLADSQLAELARTLSLETFKEDEVIVSRERGIESKFFIIKTGRVKIFDKGVVIREVDAGGTFGDILSITKQVWQFTVSSVGYSECYVMTEDSCKKLSPELLKELKHIMSLIDILVDFKFLFCVKILGSGKYCKLYLVHNTRNYYAAKFVKTKQANTNDKHVQLFLNEKNITQSINTPFAVKFVSSLKEPQAMCLLVDYVDGITLKTYIDKKKKNSFKNSFETAFYGGIILSLIKYLHRKRIVHRDIKPENFLIDKTGYLKLVEFSLSKDLKDRDYTTTICGSPHYQAPEMIRGKGYTFSVDYWSLGVTMFELFFGYLPFGNSASDVNDIYCEILNNKLALPQESRLNEINNLLNILLAKTPQQRICDFPVIRSHPFFQDIDFDQLNNLEIQPPFIPDGNIEHMPACENNSNVHFMTMVENMHYEPEKKKKEMHKQKHDNDDSEEL